MYKPSYQVKRLRNMVVEWCRLTYLYFFSGWRNGTNHLLADWHYKSPKVHPFRYATVISHVTDPSWHKDYHHVIRTQVKTRRDIFDQVLDVVTEMVKRYWENIFVIETCSHLHQNVYAEWEGDEKDGYYSDITCGVCHSSLIKDTEIDRYLPPEDRHPELAQGTRVHPIYRTTHVDDDEPLIDDEAFQTWLGKLQ